MRVQIITPRLDLESGGGSHRTLDLKLRYLIAAGHQARLTTIFSGGNKFTTTVPYQIDQKQYTGTSFVALQKKVAQLLFELEDQTDVFELEGPAFLWAGGMYKQRGGKKPVVAFLNNYTDGMRIKKITATSAIGFAKAALYQSKRFLWEKCLGLRYVNSIDLFFADSPVVKKAYVAFGFAAQKITVMAPFIDLQQFTVGLTTKQTDVLELLYVGRLTKDKGLDLLLEAIASPDLREKVALTIIGRGQARAELEALIARYTLATVVTIHDWVAHERINEYYAQADVFVHPSRWPEPFGLTIVEAMAMGVPVITASQTGSAWVVGEAGLVFTKNRSQSLREKISQFILEPTLRARLSAQARQRAQAFDYRVTAKQYEAALQELSR